MREYSPLTPNTKYIQHLVENTSLILHKLCEDLVMRIRRSLRRVFWRVCEMLRSFLSKLLWDGVTSPVSPPPKAYERSAAACTLIRCVGERNWMRNVTDVFRFLLWSFREETSSLFSFYYTLPCNTNPPRAIPFALCCPEGLIKGTPACVCWGNRDIFLIC